MIRGDVRTVCAVNTAWAGCRHRTVGVCGRWRSVGFPQLGGRAQQTDRTRRSWPQWCDCRPFAPTAILPCHRQRHYVHAIHRAQPHRNTLSHGIAACAFRHGRCRGFRRTVPRIATMDCHHGLPPRIATMHEHRIFYVDRDAKCHTEHGQTLMNHGCTNGCPNGDQAPPRLVSTPRSPPSPSPHLQTSTRPRPPDTLG